MSSTTTIDDKSLDDRSLGPDDDVFRLRPERLSTAESLWVSESLPPVREAVFVAVVCMAQFCTRGLYGHAGAPAHHRRQLRGVVAAAAGVARGRLLADGGHLHPLLRAARRRLRVQARAAGGGVVALVLFNFAWTQAPISGWATPTILVPLVLGLLLLGAFAVVEFRVSRKPLVPFDAVNADVAFVLAAVACGWASFGVWTLYLVQVLQDVRGLSPLLTTAWFLPVVFLGICAAVVTGKLLGPLQVRPPYVMAMALLAFTLGSVLTASTPPGQSYWGQTFVSMLVMPFGMDMSFPAATLILSDAVPKRHQGVGASLVNTVVNYGIALGVGFAGTVEVQVHGHGDTPDDLMRGFRGALYMGVGLAGLGLAVSLWFVAREHVLKKRG
ncbi:MFS transporter, partial [Metarhizium hybridum]